IFRKVGTPPNALSKFSVFVNDQLAGAKLAYVLECAPGSRSIFQAQIMIKSSKIRFAGDGGMLQNRFNVRGEKQTRASHREIERFDARPVPRKQKPPARNIPKRDRKHSVEFIEELIAVLFVEVNKDLCVRMIGPEAVTLRFQFRLQL